MAQLNLYSDISSIAQSVQEHAISVVRETGQMQGLVTVFADMTGLNTRKGYAFNQGTAQAVGEDDDLTSRAFTPSIDHTLTPAEIGLLLFLSDIRAEIAAPERTS